MLLTRAERRLIRRRRRRHLTGFIAIVLMLAGWASAQHNLPAHHHRHHAHVSRRVRLRFFRPNGTPRVPVPTARPDLTLASYHGIAVPFSPTDGPHHRGGGLAWGFTDTPDGAVLAAVNIAIRTAAPFGPAIYEATIRRQVTGRAAVALLRADTGAYAALRAATRIRRGQPAGQVRVAITAYRITAWDPARATVAIVTQAPGATGQLVTTATTVRVIWLRGDWRVIAPPGGDWARAATSVKSLTGYVLFPEQR